MEKEQRFQCAGDCMNCRAVNDRKIQWQYCAAQITYNSMRMLQDMQESMKVMSGAIDDLKEKIAAIQNNEAMVIEPSMQVPPMTHVHDIAQSGDGAGIEAPIQLNN